MEQSTLYASRREFDQIRTGGVKSLVVLNSEAETLGAVSHGAEINLREVLEGLPTRRWMVLSLESIGPPTDEGTIVAFTLPPVAFHDGGNQWA